MRLLIVEDEDLLRARLVKALDDSGYVVDSASDGKTGLFEATENDYDAAIIDLGAESSNAKAARVSAEDQVLTLVPAVRGLAEEVTSAHRAELIERTWTSGARPWAPGPHGRWLRIIPQGISGRRIVPGELPPPFGPKGYL